MPDDPRFLPRCRRAARAMAWWGRIAIAAWVLEIITLADLRSGLFPVIVLAFVTETQAPMVRKGKSVRGLLFFHFVALTWNFAYLGAVAQRGVESGRTLGFAGAVFLLGAISVFQLFTVWLVLPPLPDPRSEREIRADRLFAWAGAALAVLLGVFALHLAEDFRELGALVCLFFFAGVAWTKVRLVLAGEWRLQAVTLACLFVLVFTVGLISIVVSGARTSTSALTLLGFALSVVTVVLGIEALRETDRGRKRHGQ